MKAELLKQSQRRRRRNSVRRRIKRGGRQVRLSVHRSSKHMYAQVIDDASGRTLCSAGTTEKAVADAVSGKSKCDAATIIGREIAERAKSSGVSEVVFDRGGFRYHGRVKALAEAAREGGLVF